MRWPEPVSQNIVHQNALGYCQNLCIQCPFCIHDWQAFLILTEPLGLQCKQASMEQQPDGQQMGDRDAFADIIDPRALLSAAGAASGADIGASGIGGDLGGIIEVCTSSSASFIPSSSCPVEILDDSLLSLGKIAASGADIGASDIGGDLGGIIEVRRHMTHESTRLASLAVALAAAASAMRSVLLQCRWGKDMLGVLYRTMGHAYTLLLLVCSCGLIFGPITF